MSSGSERVLILAPFGRDGVLLQRALQQGRIEAEICPGLEELCGSIEEGAGALLIGDEAMGVPQISRLSEVLNEQPHWSELNIVIMTSGGGSTAASERRVRLLEPIQSPMILLERPLRTATLISAAHSALRARRRQYQVRDLLERERQNAASLQFANEALRQSNRRLAEFGYVVSHDLKEPLRTVTAYTQLLSRRLKGRLDGEAEKYVQFVTDGALRMTQLIEGLLNYAQVTEESSQPGVQADCHTALRLVKDNLGVLIQETGAVIAASALPVVSVESRQLVQLFQNLIGNAIKYRKNGEPPRVGIKAVQQGSFWLFQIADNGIGFEQTYAEQIFGVFKRLHRNDEMGTGIGLAICKRIVEHYGGRIWASSSPGEGSVFSFLLPGVEPTDG